MCEKTQLAIVSKTYNVECALTSSNYGFLRQAITRLSLSARAYHRILKLARTIADHAVQDHINSAYIGEAIQYRRLDKSQSG